MDIISKNKGTVLVMLLFFAMVVGYQFWPKDTFVESEPIVGADAAETVALYEKFQLVTLDQSVFSIPGYRSLKDFSTALPTQPQGRPNPFEEI